jgi:hypothetical protein
VNAWGTTFDLQIESALNGIGDDDALIVSAIAGLVAGVVYFLGAKSNNLYNNVAQDR